MDKRKTYSFTVPGALPLGVFGSVVLLFASFSGGATRNQGGLLEALNIGFLAYGHGRNLGMLAYWIGLIALVLAWVLAARQVIVPHLRGEMPDAYRRIRTMLIAWTAPLLLAAPLASRDVYSYLMQGAMVRDGFDPYTEGPAVNPGPFLLEVSPDWRNTTTPYGPLHLWMGEGVTRLVGDNVAAGMIVYKVISVLGFVGIAWAVTRIARKLGGNAALALWLGVANPVVVLHLIGGMHNESTMVALVSIGLLAALHQRFHIALILVGIAVAMKATALIAMPFIVWLMVQHYAGKASFAKQAGVFVVSGIVAVVEIVIALAVITWASGLTWGWLSEITGNSKVINPLAGPTLLTDIIAPLLQVINPDISYNAVLEVLRTIATVFMLVGLVAVWWLSRHNARTAIMGTAAAYQVAFIFNSVTLPWYYVSVLTLLGTFRPPSWLIKLATGASVFIGLAFASDGNHQLYNWRWVLGMAIATWFITQWALAGLPQAGEKEDEKTKKPSPARAE
ncbi:MAG: alpha-(1-_6)-mannopyranosyltransferase A [Corynebacterium camporealensis]|uniref:alpha-(1->6)-mannopyranosyltransferase A n=1 Tax=Corynebacterium camporealensis TaxID=161896 RepID=UPI002A91F338|nr:alpha-(1->6)-mannopyranosyltransferase A [Corynebacterium camporealensis]MDY5840313.1 alpha-(1->6)-mannopyranosyltransferase A [Corynebacterium camporealensis]